VPSPHGIGPHAEDHTLAYHWPREGCASQKHQPVHVADGSKAVRFRPSKCFPVCTSMQTQGVHERRIARTPQAPAGRVRRAKAGMEQAPWITLKLTPGWPIRIEDAQHHDGHSHPCSVSAEVLQCCLSVLRAKFTFPHSASLTCRPCRRVLASL
jgi:hypothetical protein